MTRPLQINPGPLAVVPDAVRDAWMPAPYRWRCDHEDGRGRCTSRETTAKWNPETRTAEHYCDKHAAS